MDKETFLKFKDKFGDKILQNLNSVSEVYDERRKQIYEIFETYKDSTNRDKVYGEHISLICKVDCDSEYRAKFRQYLGEIELRYSFKNLRLEVVYNRKTVYNGSDPHTYSNLMNAVIYQMAFTYKWSKELSANDFGFLCLCFVLKLMTNVNNSITYNPTCTAGNISYIGYTYRPIDKTVICEMIKIIYERFSENNVYITFTNGHTYTFNIGNDEQDYHTKRFSEDVLRNFINTYYGTHMKKPTVSELFTYINDSMDEPLVNTKTNLKYYINLYGLSDSVNIQHRKTKAEMVVQRALSKNNKQKK